MIGIVLVTHGNLALEFVAALEHVVGPQQCISAVVSAPRTTWKSGAARFSSAHAPAITGEGVILLTDMFGGTPSNLAISIMDQARIRSAGRGQPADAGEARQRVRNRPIAEAVRMAQEAGRKYIHRRLAHPGQGSLVNGPLTRPSARSSAPWQSPTSAACTRGPRPSSSVRQGSSTRSSASTSRARRSPPVDHGLMMLAAGIGSSIELACSAAGRRGDGRPVRAWSRANSARTNAHKAPRISG